jgi:hypothetical protein
LSLARVRVLASPRSTSRSSSSLPATQLLGYVTILSWGSALLQGFTHTLRRAPLSPGPSHGVPAPSAFSTSGVRFLPGVPIPGTFRLQGFAPSCRLSPPDVLRVCFTPVTPLGFRPPGVSPPKERRHLIGVRLALVAFPPDVQPTPMVCAGLGRPTGLPRAAAGPFSAFRAFIPPGVRARRRPPLRSPRVVPLLGFLLPTVFPSSECGTDFAAPPLACFSESDCRRLLFDSLTRRHLRVSPPRSGGVASLEVA